MSIHFYRKSLLALAIASVTGAGFLAAPAHAAIDTWTGATSVTWSVGTNWSSTPNPPANDLVTDIALFNSATYTHQPNAGTVSISGIQIGASSGALALAGTQLSIGANGITMANGAAASTISSPITLGADQTWTNSAATTLTIGTGAITGGGFNLTVANNGSAAAGLTVSSAMNNLGSLTVNNTNSGTGVVTISGALNSTGTLNLNNTAAGAIGVTGAMLGTGSGTFTINANGLDNVSGAINGWANVNINNNGASAGQVTVSSIIAGGGGLSGVGNLSISNTNSSLGGGNLTVSGTIVGTGTLSVSNSTFNNTTLASQINGFSAVSVTVGSSNYVYFSGGYAGGYAGATTITGGGTLTLDPSAAVANAQAGATGATNVQNGTLKAGVANAFLPLGVITLGGSGTTGTLDLGGVSAQIGGLANGAGALTSNEIVTNSGAAATLTVNTSLGSSSFNGVIQNGTSANGFALKKAGLNTLTLTGINTYSGATSGTQGTINYVGQSGGSTQTLGALSFASGGIVIESTYGGAGTTALNFTGTLVNSAGATADFVINGGVSGSTNTITVGTATTAANTILGTWAFFGAGASTQYLIQSSGVLGGYTSGNVVTDANSMTVSTNTTAANGNYELSLTALDTLIGNATAYSVRYTGAGQTIATSGFTLTTNGIINASSGTLAITNTGAGGLAIGSSNVLVLDAANANIELASPYVQNSTTAQSITIAGPNSVIFDTSITNANTGTLTVNDGSAGVGAVVIGSSENLALDANAGSLVVNAPIADSASGASSVTISSNGAFSVKLTGANTFTGGLTVTTGSTLDISSANGAVLGTGTVTFQQGSTLTATGAFTNTVNNSQVWAGDFTMSGTTAMTLGTYFIGATQLAPGVGNPSGAHTLTLTDNNTSTVTLGAISDGGLNVGLTKSGGTGAINLDGFNTFTGALTINNGTISFTNVFNINPVNPVYVNAGATLGLNSEVVYFAGLGDSTNGGGGLSSATSGRTFNLLGSDTFNTTGVDNTYAFSGVIGSSAPTDIGLIKGGTSTQYLTGKNLFTLGTTVASGALILDFSGLSTPNEAAGATPTSNILTNTTPAGSALAMAGGTLGLIGGSAAATSYSQSVSTFAVNAGGSTVELTANGGDDLLLDITSTFSRATAGTVNFILPSGTQSATNGVTTSAANNNGVLGGYATVSGADWATVSSGNIVAYTGYTPFIGAASTAASNYLISPGDGDGTGADAISATETFNSLKINPSGSGQTLTINAGAILTLTNGGLLFTGNNDYTIAGANAATSKLAGATAVNGTGTNNEIIIQQYAASNNLTIGALIATANFTKSGPGTLTLTNTNAISGTVTLNAGVTNINTLAALGTGATINFNGGTLQYASPTSASPFTGSGDITQTTAGAARQVDIGYAGATIDTNGNNITFANATSLMGGQDLSGALTGYFGGLTKTGAGTLTISNAVSYYGPTVISGGVLSIGSGTLPVTASLTEAGGTATSGGVITGLSSVAGIFVGEVVTGASIPVAQIVTVVNTSNNTINTNTSQAGGGNPVTFGGFNPLGDAGPGISSSIGLSDSAAQNLVLDSGTLQYTGGTTSTDRLFTVTQNGGGLDASGVGALTFSSPGALVFVGAGNRTLTLTGTNTGNNTLAPIISDPSSGSTALTKSGSGTWILTGAETYTGATTITGGTLKLAAVGNNIAGSSKIIVGAAAGDGSVLDVTGVAGGFTLGGTQTLAGHGQVNGTVTTAGGSHLAPGNSLGTLTFNNDLSIVGGTSLDYDLGAPGTSDLTAVVGTLTLSSVAGSIQVNLTDAGGMSDGVYKLFTYGTLAGGASPDFDSTFTINSTPLVGQTYTFSNTGASGGEIDLTIASASVPEPASLALLGLGSALLLRRKRRV